MIIIDVRAIDTKTNLIELLAKTKSVINSCLSLSLKMCSKRKKGLKKLGRMKFTFRFNKHECMYSLKYVISSLIICLLPTTILSQNTLKDIGKHNNANIAELSAKYEVPLVIISDRIYLPASDCLDMRKIQGDTEDRKLSGDTENRKLGGYVEDRKLGGDTENRKLGGDIENRKLGGNTENRKLGGDVEDRKLSGDTENRKLGRDVENRKLGGDTENRKLGGDTAEIECVKLKDQSGFLLKNVNPNAEIFVYYRGILKKIESMLIVY